MPPAIFPDEQLLYSGGSVWITNRRLIIGRAECRLDSIKIATVKTSDETVRRISIAGIGYCLLLLPLFLMGTFPAETSLFCWAIILIVSFTIGNFFHKDLYLRMDPDTEFLVLKAVDTNTATRICELINKHLPKPTPLFDLAPKKTSPQANEHITTIPRYEPLTEQKIDNVSFPEDETTHYATGTIKVTATRVIVGETTYAVSQITSVAIKPDEQARRGILIVGSCISAPVVLGVAASTTAPIIWVLTFFAVVAFTVCLMSANQSKALFIATAAGEVQAVSGVEERQLQEIAQAINAAIVARG